VTGIGSYVHDREITIDPLQHELMGRYTSGSCSNGSLEVVGRHHLSKRVPDSQRIRGSEEPTNPGA